MNKKKKITALVILENHFFRDENGLVWCNRIVDYDYLKRYLAVFDEVLVCARFTNKAFKEQNCLLVSGDRVSFLELPDFQGSKGLITHSRVVRKIIKEHLHCFGCCIMRAPSPLAYLLHDIFIKKHIPLAIEFVVAADKMIEGRGFLKNLINKFLISYAKKMCMSANGVSYVTSYVLQNVYPCRALIENSSRYFTANYSSIDLEKKLYYEQNWKRLPEVFHLVHTGYMDSYRKGQDTLIRMVSVLVRNGYSNFKLELIGDGAKFQEFKNLAKELGVLDYIVFSGLITSKQELLKHLRKSHIFIFPTRSEGLPRALIEAMASSLCCVASPVDGNVELLSSEFLVPYDDISGLASKVAYLMDHFEVVINASKVNYVKALEYEKSNLVRKRLEFYQKLYNLACEEE